MIRRFHGDKAIFHFSFLICQFSLPGPLIWPLQLQFRRFKAAARNPRISSRRSRRHNGSPQRELWVNEHPENEAREEGDINAPSNRFTSVLAGAYSTTRAVYVARFCGLLFLGTRNPQLALWATVMASATPTGENLRTNPQGKNIVDAGVSGAYSARVRKKCCKALVH